MSPPHTSEGVAEAVLQATDAPALVLDPDTGEVLSANPPAARLFGADRETLEGDRVTDQFEGTDERRTVRGSVRAAARDGPVTVEWPVGDRATAMRLRAAPGEAVVAVGTTPGDEADVGTASSGDGTTPDGTPSSGGGNDDVPPARFDALFDSPDLFVGFLDTDGRLLEANETALEFAGLEAGEVAGEYFPETPWWSDPSDRATLAAAIAGARSGEASTFTAEHVSPGGRRVFVSVSVRPVFDGDDVCCLVVEGRDVTEQVEARREMRQRTEHLRTVVENLPVVVFTLDATGEFAESYGAGLEPLGLEDGDLVGRSIVEAYGDYEGVVEDTERALDGEASRSELEIEGVVYDTWFEPVLDGDGAVDHVVGLAWDVTEMKRRQERLTEQRERMAFFNGILRHDVLNGMNVIHSRATLLDEELEGEHAEYAETIREWSDDIVDLTRKVRAIIRSITEADSLDLEPIDVEPTLEHAAERARSMDPEATARVDAPADLTVTADDFLRDVFVNLTTNAVEHGGEAPTVRITARRTGDRVAVTVADDGPGVDEGVESIFERGEPVETGSGPGFGLYFVQQMVEAYGGGVTVRDSDLGGAAFVVELPAAE
ncbi:MAG: PAS domain-containing protein [Haloarculaceae archaeon]